MSNYYYNKYNADQQSALLNKEKASDLADRVSQFGSVDSFDDAIKLADKIIPTENELTSFNYNAKGGHAFAITNITGSTVSFINRIYCYVG